MVKNCFKKFTYFLLACFAVQNTAATGYAVSTVSSFPDVSTDYKYFTAIEYFKEKNVIQATLTALSGPIRKPSERKR